MIKNNMTPAEAWNDFFAWAMSPEIKPTFKVKERHYLNKTNCDVQRNKCGIRRIKNALAQYGQGRYVWRERFEVDVFK